LANLKEYVVRVRVTIERELVVLGNAEEINKNPYDSGMLLDSRDLEFIGLQVLSMEPNE
jgi:hypothetical protein